MNHGIHIRASVATDDPGEVAIANIEFRGDLGKYNEETFDEVRTGTARCDPQDKGDHATGELLALGRAFERMGKRLQREAWGRVKHQDHLRAQREDGDDG